MQANLRLCCSQTSEGRFLILGPICYQFITMFKNSFMFLAYSMHLYMAVKGLNWVSIICAAPPMVLLPIKFQLNWIKIVKGFI